MNYWGILTSIISKQVYEFKERSYLMKLAKQKQVTILSNCEGYRKVNFTGGNRVHKGCLFYGSKINIGLKTTIGYRNLIAGDVTIGKYCQIGADVAMISTNHPINYLTTYINKELLNGELQSIKEENKIILGNDIWVGHGVRIVGNVSIGNGAILASGAVVTKDVPPYAIVGGVPAKVIKYRFNQNIINEIEELKWWDKSDEELNQIKNLFFKDFSKLNSIYDGH